MRKKTKFCLPLFMLLCLFLFNVVTYAEPVGMSQNLTSGTVSLPFPSADDSTFRDGYIYPMSFTAPDNGWYYLHASGDGVVLGYSNNDNAQYGHEFSTYKNNDISVDDPILSYCDSPLREGAVCGKTLLKKGETWTFSIIGKNFYSVPKYMKFEVRLARAIPKIQSITVTPSVAHIGDTVSYHFTFDCNLEEYGFDDVNLGENVYGPDGNTDLHMSPYWQDTSFEITGNNLYYRYTVTPNQHDCVLKPDYLSLSRGYSLSDRIDWANDSRRSWWEDNLVNDMGYLPNAAVKIQANNCYHNDSGMYYYGTEKKVTKATLTANGKIVETCRSCNDVLETKKISYPKIIKLSDVSYTYDGRVKKPAVSVVDASGKIVSSSNYTVTYPSGRKNVGKYTVKVTFKGNYSGTKKLTFKIVPTKTSIKTLSQGTKSFKVTWIKKVQQVTGYEIQYSLKSNFLTGNKTVKISSYKTTGKIVKNLKAKKKYYVRVRTYKIVGKNKFYSTWSAKKIVITK